MMILNQWRAFRTGNFAAKTGAVEIFFSLVDSLKQILAAVGKKIVAFFSDGTLVMIGKSNGEAAKLKNI